MKSSLTDKKESEREVRVRERPAGIRDCSRTVRRVPACTHTTLLPESALASACAGGVRASVGRYSRVRVRDGLSGARWARASLAGFGPSPPIAGVCRLPSLLSELGFVPGFIKLSDDRLWQSRCAMQTVVAVHLTKIDPCALRLARMCPKGRAERARAAA